LTKARKELDRAECCYQAEVDRIEKEKERIEDTACKEQEKLDKAAKRAGPMSTVMEIRPCRNLMCHNSVAAKVALPASQVINCNRGAKLARDSKSLLGQGDFYTR